MITETLRLQKILCVSLFLWQQQQQKIHNKIGH